MAEKHASQIEQTGFPKVDKLLKSLQASLIPFEFRKFWEQSMKLQREKAGNMPVLTIPSIRRSYAELGGNRRVWIEVFEEVVKADKLARQKGYSSNLSSKVRVGLDIAVALGMHETDDLALQPARKIINQLVSDYSKISPQQESKEEQEGGGILEKFFPRRERQAPTPVLSFDEYSAAVDEYKNLTLNEYNNRLAWETNRGRFDGLGQLLVRTEEKNPDFYAKYCVNRWVRYKYGVENFKLDRLDGQEKINSSPEARGIMSEDSSREFNAIPLGLRLIDGKSMLDVAFANIPEIEALEKLEAVTGKIIHPVLADPEQVRQAIEQGYKLVSTPQKDSEQAASPAETEVQSLLEQLRQVLKRDGQGNLLITDNRKAANLEQGLSQAFEFQGDESSETVAQITQEQRAVSNTILEYHHQAFPPDQTALFTQLLEKHSPELAEAFSDYAKARAAKSDDTRQADAYFEKLLNQAFNSQFTYEELLSADEQANRLRASFLEAVSGSDIPSIRGTLAAWNKQEVISAGMRLNENRRLMAFYRDLAEKAGLEIITPIENFYSSLARADIVIDLGKPDEVLALEHLNGFETDQKKLEEIRSAKDFIREQANDGSISFYVRDPRVLAFVRQLAREKDLNYEIGEFTYNKTTGKITAPITKIQPATGLNVSVLPPDNRVNNSDTIPLNQIDAEEIITARNVAMEAIISGRTENLSGLALRLSNMSIEDLRVASVAEMKAGHLQHGAALIRLATMRQNWEIAKDNRNAIEKQLQEIEAKKRSSELNNAEYGYFARSILDGELGSEDELVKRIRRAVSEPDWQKIEAQLQLELKERINQSIRIKWASPEDAEKDRTRRDTIEDSWDNYFRTKVPTSAPISGSVLPPDDRVENPVVDWSVLPPRANSPTQADLEAAQANTDRMAQDLAREALEAAARSMSVPEATRPEIITLGPGDLLKQMKETLEAIKNSKDVILEVSPWVVTEYLKTLKIPVKKVLGKTIYATMKDSSSAEIIGNQLVIDGEISAGKGEGRFGEGAKFTVKLENNPSGTGIQPIGFDPDDPEQLLLTGQAQGQREKIVEAIPKLNEIIIEQLNGQLKEQKLESWELKDFHIDIEKGKLVFEAQRSG